MQRFRAPASGLVCATGALLFCAGCGGPGTVSGKVSLDGAPLPGGLVSFHDSEGQTRSGGISREGTYSVSNIAPGKTQVSVLTLGERRGLREPEDGKRAVNSLGPYVPIPAKYLDKEQSGLSLQVKTGRQQFEIQLHNDADTEVKEQPK
jgi:hypothetical protein